MPGDCRLLIAEDNEINSKVLASMLRYLGLECKVARNGAEAVRLAASWRPDLIFMDMRMPVMDGYEATRKIKGTPEGKDTPVIAVSASVFEHERAAMTEGGCTDFIPKPLDENVVYRKLGQYLGLKFVYEARESGGSADDDGEFSVCGALGSISQELREALEAAVLDVDPPEIAWVVDEIGAAHEELGIRLKKLLDNFRYDEILEQLEKVKAAT